jgi:hypothetical protein
MVNEMMLQPTAVAVMATDGRMRRRILGVQDVLLVWYLTTSDGKPSQILVVVIRMAGMAGRPMDPRVSFRLVERLTHLWGVVQHCAHGQRSTGRLANLHY